MKYFELRCTAYIKKDISYEKSFNILSKYISFSMAQDDKLKELHINKKGYKYYNFDNFYPIEKDKIYKKGNNYQISLRSPNIYFIDTISQLLRENINNEYFQIIITNKRTVSQFFISELYTLTPTIVTVGNNLFWTIDRDGDIAKLQKQLHDNLEKKYYDFYNEKLDSDQNFIQLIEIKNRVPFSIKSIKNQVSFRLFGNKFKIIPNEDEVSQKLAFMALSCGLGEKNSFGGGFCIWN